MASKQAKLKTKVVVRNLPPGLPEDSFKSAAEDLLKDSVTWFAYFQGKESLKRVVFSKAFIAFRDEQSVYTFKAKFDGHLFVSSKGTQHRCSVQYAPFQKVPTPPKKKDAREGTIDADPDYQEFLRQLEAGPQLLPSAAVQLEQREATAVSAGVGSEPGVRVTPLMEYLRKRYASKASFRPGQRVTARTVAALALEPIAEGKDVAVAAASATEAAGHTSKAPSKQTRDSKAAAAAAAATAMAAPTATPTGQGKAAQRPPSANEPAQVATGKQPRKAAAEGGRAGQTPAPKLEQPTKPAAAATAVPAADGGRGGQMQAARPAEQSPKAATDGGRAGQATRNKPQASEPTSNGSATRPSSAKQPARQQPRQTQHQQQAQPQPQEHPRILKQPDRTQPQRQTQRDTPSNAVTTSTAAQPAGPDTAAAAAPASDGAAPKRRTRAGHQLFVPRMRQAIENHLQPQQRAAAAATPTAQTAVAAALSGVAAAKPARPTGQPPRRQQGQQAGTSTEPDKPG